MLENTNKDLKDIKTYIESIECDSDGKIGYKSEFFY